ncbi:hypothetical protein HD600_001118 [Microbacterium ginsengiterrae]|uniref:Uncharacterized protein n=1 Tax=Microbacterium ginsengiterrae TaxID=546115 RepID=A0A7W9CBM1_9MICO|nr:hypothetical protein [Microbacterium ginsengiterrae]
MADRTILVDLEPRAPVESSVVAPRQAKRVGGRAGQHRQERIEDVRFELLSFRELPEDGTECGTEREDTGGEEVRKARLGIPHAQHVRHVSRPFDREDEALRHGVAPSPVALRALQRVEGPVELDGRELRPHELQFPALHQPARVEVSAPTRISPPGGADAHGTGIAVCQRVRHESLVSAAPA